MSEYGNSKKLENFDYKSEGFPSELSKNMSPNISFKHEIVKEAHGYKDGDKTFALKELDKIEEVPEGFSGGYSPMNRPNLAEQVQTIGKALMSPKLRELSNSAVQLFNVMVKDFIRSNLSSEETKKYKIRDLKFEAIENIFTDPVRLEKIKSTEAYKDLANIYYNDNRFNRIRARRNKFIHPGSIDVDDVEQCQNDIIEEYLEPEEKALLIELKHVIKILTDCERANNFLE